MNKIVTIRINQKDYESIKLEAEKIGISVGALVRFYLFKGRKTETRKDQGREKDD